MENQPFKIVFADDFEGLASFDGDVLKIRKGIAILAPPFNQPGLETEIKAFQVFTNDIMRYATVRKEGKSAAEAFGSDEVYRYYRTRPHDLLILLDICTRGEYGSVDVSRFRYFDVTRLKMDEAYTQVLKKVKTRLDKETDKPPEFPW